MAENYLTIIPSRHVRAKIKHEFTVYEGMEVSWFVGDWHTDYKVFECWGIATTKEGKKIMLGAHWKEGSNELTNIKIIT